MEARYGWKAWQVVAVNCVLCACVPAYGLLGLASPALGFRRHYDMLLGVALYGVRGSRARCWPPPPTPRPPAFAHPGLPHTLPLRPFLQFQVGSIQSYSRAAYGAMVPRGQESRFYGLWSFVDKGSSWVGPAVVSVILQYTGNIRLGFAFPLAVLLPPCLVLGCIDYDKGAEDARAFAEAWARERSGGSGGGGGGGGAVAGADEGAPAALLRAPHDK